MGPTALGVCAKLDTLHRVSDPSSGDSLQPPIRILLKVNLRTARSLGSASPRVVLARIDEVIEEVGPPCPHRVMS
jgi:hypothetical protein